MNATAVGLLCRERGHKARCFVPARQAAGKNHVPTDTSATALLKFATRSIQPGRASHGQRNGQRRSRKITDYQRSWESYCRSICRCSLSGNKKCGITSVNQPLYSARANERTVPDEKHQHLGVSAVLVTYSPVDLGAIATELSGDLVWCIIGYSKFVFRWSPEYNVGRATAFRIEGREAMIPAAECQSQVGDEFSRRIPPSIKRTT
jgi:hypothetical protein